MIAGEAEARAAGPRQEDPPDSQRAAGAPGLLDPLELTRRWQKITSDALCECIIEKFFFISMVVSGGHYNETHPDPGLDYVFITDR